MNIFLTITIGVTIFVFGQIFLKLFIDPWQLQRECIAKISHHLLLYRHVYSNPGVLSEEKNRDVGNEARKLASELIASCNRIPFYKFLSKSGLFPTIKTISKVQRNLIGLSNSTFDVLPNQADVNTETIKEIKESLRLIPNT